MVYIQVAPLCEVSTTDYFGTPHEKPFQVLESTDLLMVDLTTSCTCGEHSVRG